jgi:ABC-type transport system involved in multi-copper enzyme maturation permease subunit
MHSLAARIRGLSPFGPIFGKELRVTSRRKRTYILRTSYLLVLFLVILSFYAGNHERFSGSVVVRAQRNAELGAEFFAVFAFFSCFAMALIGPILTATAINSERLQNTLAVLMMTPINAWQIAAGKLFSRLLVAITLLGLSLPVLAVVRLLGGVEGWQVGAVLLLSLSTVIFTASLGLFISTIASRAYAVIILSYAILLLIWAAIPSALAMFGAWLSQNRPSEWPVYAYCGVILPFFQIAQVVSLGMLPASVAAWPVCVIYQFVVSTLLLLWTALLLRRRARRELAGETAVARVQPPPLPPASAQTAGKPPVPAAVGAPAASPQAPPSQQSRQRDVGDNPVLWREIRRPVFAKVWQRVAAILIVLGCLMGMYILIHASSYSRTSNLLRPDTHAVFACVFCGILTVVGAIFSATAIAAEKEGNTWTLLIATPLSARQIVLGKLAGMLRRLWWPMLLVIGNFTAFGLFGALSPVSVAVIIWITASCNVIWVATGLYLSLQVKSATFAAVLNLLLPLGLYLGVLVLLAIADGFGNARGRIIELEGLYAPYSYLVTATELTPRRYDFGSSGDWPAGTKPVVSMPVFNQVPTIAFVVAAGATGLAYLSIAGLVVGWTIVRFDHIVGRAQEGMNPFVSPLPPPLPLR